MSRQEFIDAVRAQAFAVTDPDSMDFGRFLVHCQSGMFGADWDRERVVEEIEDAREVRWIEGAFARHELGVMGADGRVRLFQVRNPEAGQ